MELLRGGRAPVAIGACTIEVEGAIVDDDGGAVDAVVVEEDTYLSCAAPAQVDVRAPLPMKERLSTLTRGFGAEPQELGTLILRQGRPLVMLAIVIDVDAHPPVREEHVARAYARALAVCRAQSLARVRTALLGVRGGLAPTDSMRLLVDAARAHGAPLAIAVACTSEHDDAARAALDEAGAQQP